MIRLFRTLSKCLTDIFEYSKFVLKECEGDKMNVPIWVAWIIVVILAVFSMAIITGKVPFLIAGYNTANKEEKNKYNMNTLCKVIGGGFGIITVIVALVALYNGELPSAISWLIPWGILGTIALMFIIGNTACKK